MKNNSEYRFKNQMFSCLLIGYGWEVLLFKVCCFFFPRYFWLVCSHSVIFGQFKDCTQIWNQLQNKYKKINSSVWSKCALLIPLAFELLLLLSHLNILPISQLYCIFSLCPPWLPLLKWNGNPAVTPKTKSTCTKPLP